MIEILYTYLNFLWETFQYDMNVFSQGWLYYWLLIPAVGYLIFFFIKWAVITAPVWFPIKLIFEAIGSIFKK